ncbi:MAG: glycosyltransferase [Spirosomataceae bacterium]
MNKKPVLLIHPSGYISISPTIISIIQYLNEKNYRVDIISVFGEDVPELPCRTYCLIKKEKHRSLFFPIKVLLNLLLYFVYPFYLLIHLYRNQYKNAFAIDVISLFFALFIPKKITLIYVVLHIQYLKELIQQRNIPGILLKYAERIQLKKTKFILIQDSYRKQSFIEENKINPQFASFFLVPNAYRGDSGKGKTTYYQQKYALPCDSKIVLLAGAVEAWSFPVFLAQCAASPSNSLNYRLIIQSRESVSESSPLICELRSMEEESENVILSLTPLPVHSLHEAFSSAHIGCALYTNDNFKNQTFVGGASGKMLSYLKSGLPVIMMDSPGVTEIINQYRCGKVLSTMDIISFNHCVEEIIKNYTDYSANAYRCYQELYDFDHAFHPVFAILS